MSDRFAEILANGPVVTDGSWGTQLQARGLEPGMPPDALNILKPEAVEAVAAGYAEAGSRIILTNTFGANRYVLDRAGYAQQVTEVNRAGVALSRKAAAGRCLVFASMGPTGKVLVMGDVTRDDLRRAFAEQAKAIAAEAPDAIVVETMMDLEELRIAVEEAKKTGLPVVASMVFDTGPNKDRSMFGVTPEQMVAAMEEAGADAVGANCGQGIEGFIPVCRRIKAATKLPVWMKPNAGLPEMVDDKTVYRTGAEEFVAQAPELLAAGADFIGGCCGSTPDFIRGLVRLVAGSR